MLLQIFILCFHGQRAVVVVEGRVGREELVKYLVEHKALVGQWSQERTPLWLGIGLGLGLGIGLGLGLGLGLANPKRLA